MRLQYLGRRLEKRPPQNFPRFEIHISDRRAHFFPQKVAESFMQHRYSAPITAAPQRYQDMNAVIVGLEAIGAIFGRTRWTIRRWIERDEFPASQLPDGTWTTTQSQIEQWLRGRMAKQ